MARRGGPDDPIGRDWVEETYAFATVHLGWSPSEFWAASPQEFWPSLKAFEKKVKALNAQS